MFATEFGTGQVLWSMLYFFLFFLWIWLVITVFADIFRDRDLSGWGKAAWTIFVIVLPYLGVFVYLIARGHKMAENSMAEAQRRDQMFRSYVRDAAGTPSSVDQLSTLSTLRSDGVITDQEYERMKAKVTAV
jgi:Phospholipase_D-nuclease N-terminal/Short C-terminal domain